jgi:hypothetical protein
MEESWHVKLRRADQHIQEFERELALFCAEAKPHDVVFEIQAHPDLSQIVLCSLSLLGDESQWLSAIAGEVAFALRSALDHIAVAFTSPGLESKVGFPILEQRFRIREERKVDIFAERTQGIPDDVKAFLLRMQPFSKPQTMPSEFLGLLNKLCNRDKHRKLLVGWLRIKDPVIVFSRTDGTELFRERIFGVYQEGANIFARPTVQLPFDPADPEVKVQAIGPVNVTLQDIPEKDVVWVLPGILTTLRVTVWRYLIAPMEARLRQDTQLPDWEATIPTIKP